MSNVAIRVEGIGKRYRIGASAERHDTLREAIMHTVRGPIRKLRSRRPNSAGADADPETFWALRDVSFEVQHGEVLGIVGKNGAGKSTLLKILSRITKPTRGRAVIHGRVGSLLEVGTGFHPELTGRENIYLNGAVLGMDRGYIDRRFDEIVEFSGVERFLDTPVKRYSSGMYLRLAFAVAAHLEPEVLIVDEVLAVGDAEFQKRCIGKLGDVARQGRTVLLVSHNMLVVQRLCDRALVLDQGATAFTGNAAECVEWYLASARRQFADQPANERLRANVRSGRGDEASIIEFQVSDSAGQPTSVIVSGTRFRIDLGVETYQTVERLSIGIGISSLEGYRLFTLESGTSLSLPSIGPGRYRFSVEWVDLQLRPGSYLIDLGYNTARGGKHYANVLQLEVLPTQGQLARGAIERRQGFLLNDMPWSMRPVGQ